MPRTGPVHDWMSSVNSGLSARARSHAKDAGNDQWNASSIYCLAKRATGASRRRTTGCLLKLCYGSPAPVAPGGIFHRNWAIGITCIRASRARARAACGSELSRRYARMRISKRSCWTAPSFVPTSMLPRPKKKVRSDWPLARRVQYQDSHGGGRVAQSAAMASHRWRGPCLHQAPALIAGVIAQQVRDKGYDSERCATSQPPRKPSASQKASRSST